MATGNIQVNITVTLSQATIEWMIELTKNEIEHILEDQDDVSVQWRELTRDRSYSEVEYDEYIQACTVLAEDYKAACVVLNELQSQIHD